jgi:threonylcarbamoyladenosine tRNA methylthiotransferase MtaB
MGEMRTYRLATLGCKVNQYETQYAGELLEANGYREAQPGERADLCLVNTCTVTHEADAQGRQLVRRLARENPGSALVVTGCYATREPETVARLPGVVKVVADKNRLADELREFGVERQPAGITRFDGHQRAFVKVQDGCLLNCSFCIIPRVRPVLRSRSVEEICEEVRRLIAGGYREIVLTGIHLGHYGIDLSRGKQRVQWRRLWHLLDAIGELPGEFRIRLSSLEAAEVRDDLVRAVADNPRICPHLHPCLQSGSDRILALMKRRYRSAGFVERCSRLRRALDCPAFTTDVIVGFPGETDADFAATCRVVREVGFVKIHVFPFSPRRGTPAAGYPDTVPPSLVRERRERLAETEREQATAYARSLLGRRLGVLVEGADRMRQGFVRGTSCRSVPVAFEGCASAFVRRLVPVRVVAAAADGVLLGQPDLEARERRLALPLAPATISVQV